MTDKPFKPMLSGTLKDFNKLRFPLLASPKLDGIRCLIVDNKPVSRKLKPIPNRYINERLSEIFKLRRPLDGELMLRDPKADFNNVQSAVMSFDGEPDFYFAAFDILDVPTTPFQERYDIVSNQIPHELIEPVPHRLIHDLDELLLYEKEMLAIGYEGVMMRSLDGEYKYGRSTENQGWLLKLKQFHDDEAVIVGFQEKMHNSNEAKTDALGHTERASCQENLVPMDTLGALEVQWGDIEFKVGTFLGFEDADKKDIWDRRDELLGKLFKFKYQELSKDGVPRFPVGLGFRHEDDR